MNHQGKPGDSWAHRAFWTMQRNNTETGEWFIECFADATPRLSAFSNISSWSLTAPCEAGFTTHWQRGSWRLEATWVAATLDSRWGKDEERTAPKPHPTLWTCLWKKGSGERVLPCPSRWGTGAYHAQEPSVVVGGWVCKWASCEHTGELPWLHREGQPRDP